MGGQPPGDWPGDRQAVKRVVVIGGGMAGISAAAHLAPMAKVTLVEMEPSLAYHTTGRSAATFIVNYGGQGSRPLARASQAFLEDPPPYAVASPLLTDRGALWVGDQSQLSYLEQIEKEGRESGAGSRLIGASEVIDLVPVMRQESVAAGLWEPSARDIDVAGLHQAFVRIARHHEAEIRTSASVRNIERTKGVWRVGAGDDVLACDAVVNASGAWGDVVAGLAGIDALGLQPLRRTAFMVPGSEEYRDWPMVIEVGHGYYFRPDGVQLLCSLAEEVLDEPGDPKPRIEDVALAIERINQATTLGIRSVNSQWTGLRTFALDRDLVIGEDPTAPGFFWLVGQGGTGIMTAPAYGALLASQVMEEATPTSLTEAGVDPDITLPDRFRT